MNMIRALRRAFARFCRVFPIDPNKCVFICFGGHSYADNPRAVSQSLHALRPGSEIIWLFTDPASKAGVTPDYVKSRRIHSPAGVYHMATANAWVLNTPAPNYIEKRPGQFYVQTWHGDRGFKVCLHESGANGLADSKMIDVCVSGSRHADTFFKSAFRYDGEIMRVGSPRDDALINPDKAEIAAIRKKLGLGDERVIIYAPTMRDSRAELKVDIDLSGILDALENRDGVKWKALVRAHFMNRALYGVEDDRRIIDASRYEDMRDLLLTADILITDYSSSAGDFVLTGKPVILYQREDEGFTEKNRRLYFDVNDTSFLVARDPGQLLEVVLGADADSKERDEDILKFFGSFETGEAANGVAMRICQHMDGRGRL
ncbi:MAG: CDP-glycerol glycerophosphotransferase family protein [Clostridia bacterium]|nr:CDP-glycerol glycerophosphotransferase family protein [Clostridia bacterium]